MSCKGSPGVHTGHLYSFCVCDCFIRLISDLPAGTLEIMYCLQSFLFLQRRPALHTQILLEYNTIVFSLASLPLLASHTTTHRTTVWAGFNTPSRPFAALRFLSCKNNFVRRHHLEPLYLLVSPFHSCPKGGKWKTNFYVCGSQSGLPGCKYQPGQFRSDHAIKWFMRNTYINALPGNYTQRGPDYPARPRSYYIIPPINHNQS